jgi:dihydropteroate synthase-like protein
MRFLLPTGAITEPIVAAIAAQFDADVVVTGKIASFLQPKQLTAILERIDKKKQSHPGYDGVFVSGMCTSSFEDVEAKFGIPIYRGPLHAADLAMILSYADAGFIFSRTIPADQLLTLEREKEAYKTISIIEEKANPLCYLQKLAIAGGARMKVLAEIMDAHLVTDLHAVITSYVLLGADIIDLGFGFDATPDDVSTVFSQVETIVHDLKGRGADIACAIDTQDPMLITAALPFSCLDLVLSLQEENMFLAPLLQSHGVCAVIVPGEVGLVKNMKAAQDMGVTCIADPVLHPIGSGLLSSIAEIHNVHINHPEWPLFFGAGNVIELIDADSIGIVATLAGMAHEAGAGIIFVSEHSYKTKGVIAEMRRATEMMVLLDKRPYPKDLGIDLFVMKEKRARQEPPLRYEEVRELVPPMDLIYDPKGNFRIGIADDAIWVEREGIAISGVHWDALFRTIEAYGWVSRLDHAAYLGKELYKAELALRFKRSFEQDGSF